MRLSFSLEASPRQVQVQICSVCKQYIDDEHFHATQEVKIVFGAAAYAVCPCCGQSVIDHTHKPYRRRADKWIAARELERSKVVHVDIWFDRHLRMWVRQEKNHRGDQIGEAEFSHQKPKS
jgi:hypothetical protein